MVLRKWESRSLPPKSRTTASCPALYFYPQPKPECRVAPWCDRATLQPTKPHASRPTPTQNPAETAEISRKVARNRTNKTNKTNMTNYTNKTNVTDGRAVGLVARSHHGATLHCGSARGCWQVVGAGWRR